jgi:predicted nucleic acid-binding Zn ribbon protein
MPSCYVCGLLLPKGQGVRREVQTGTSVSGLVNLPPSFMSELLTSFLVRMLSGKPSRSGIRTHFSMRTLCHGCARDLDRRRRRRALLQALLVALVLLSLTVVLMLGSEKP